MKRAAGNINKVCFGQLGSVRLVGFIRARRLSPGPGFVNQKSTRAAADYQYGKHDQDQRQCRPLLRRYQADIDARKRLARFRKTGFADCRHSGAVHLRGIGIGGRSCFRRHRRRQLRQLVLEHLRLFGDEFLEMATFRIAAFSFFLSPFLLCE